MSGPAYHAAQRRGVVSSKTSHHKVTGIEIHHIDVICLQETHVNDNKSDRLTISGFDIISYTLHAKQTWTCDIMFAAMSPMFEMFVLHYCFIRE